MSEMHYLDNWEEIVGIIQSIDHEKNYVKISEIKIHLPNHILKELQGKIEQRIQLVKIGRNEYRYIVTSP